MDDRMRPEIAVRSVFPTALVFGAMGWLGIVVDIGSVMTPCVAVGVTVDDVFHFLLCHRRGVRQGLSGRQETLLAYHTCGRAMVQSWGIIGIGLAVFALSSFVPIFRFGMLMLLLLTAGLAGNLVLLPALLAGPLGRWMTRGWPPRVTPVCGPGSSAAVRQPAGNERPVGRPFQAERDCPEGPSHRIADIPFPADCLNPGPQGNLPAADSGDQPHATGLSSQRDRPEGDGKYSAFSRQIQSIRS